VLKFVAGVPYHLKVRTGFTTSLCASQGRVAFFLGGEQCSSIPSKAIKGTAWLWKGLASIVAEHGRQLYSRSSINLETAVGWFGVDENHALSLA
jgi:hypothetical protein